MNLKTIKKFLGPLHVENDKKSLNEVRISFIKWLKNPDQTRYRDISGHVSLLKKLEDRFAPKVKFISTPDIEQKMSEVVLKAVQDTSIVRKLIRGPREVLNNGEGILENTTSHSMVLDLDTVSFFNESKEFGPPIEVPINKIYISAEVPGTLTNEDLFAYAAYCGQTLGLHENEVLFKMMDFCPRPRNLSNIADISETIKPIFDYYQMGFKELIVLLPKSQREAINHLLDEIDELFQRKLLLYPVFVNDMDLAIKSLTAVCFPITQDLKVRLYQRGAITSNCLQHANHNFINSIVDIGIFVTGLSDVTFCYSTEKTIEI